MARLPDFTAVGTNDPKATYVIPQYPTDDPVAAAKARAGAALSQVGQTIAGPVASAVESWQSKGTDLQEAQAKSYLASEQIKLRAAMKDETDPDKIADYTKQHQDLLDRASSIIGDGARREKFKLANISDIANTETQGSDKAFELKKDAALADSFTQLNDLQQTAASADNEEDRAKAIKAGEALYDQLRENGYITDLDAAKRKRDWSNGYTVQAFSRMSPGDRLAALQGWEGAIINKESGGNPSVQNKFGYTGLYQMGAPLLSTLGVYRPGADEDLAAWSKTSKFASGKWSGTFDIPGYPGVKTIADFRASPAAQQAVFKQSLAYYDKEIADRGLDQYIGKNVGGALITRPGLYAMMHLGGVGGAQSALITGGGSDARDANGSSVLSYARLVSGAGTVAPVTSEGLKIKSGESLAGGDVQPGLFSLAHSIQGDGNVKYFSAFNDNYHKGTASGHARGLAMDVVASDPDNASDMVESISTKLEGAGLKRDVDFKVINEYENPSPNATGGHIHVEFKSPAAAAKYAAATSKPSDGSSPLTKFLNPGQREQMLESTRRELVQQSRSDEASNRQETATVKSLMSDDNQSIMSTGQPVAELTPDRVSAALGSEAAEAFQQDRGFASAYHQQTNDLETLPEAEVEQRVESLKPKPGVKGYAKASKYYDAAVEKRDDILKARRTDPALAVSNDPAVVAASKGASLDNPDSFAPVAKARMIAQDKLGIPEDARSPITKNEALTLWKGIENAAPADQREAIQDVVEAVNKAFGDDADTVISQIFKAGHADKATRALTAAVIKKLAKAEMPTPQEAQAIDASTATQQRQAAIAPIQEPMSPMLGMGFDGGYSPYTQLPNEAPRRYPVPTPNAMSILLQNPSPDRIAQFNREDHFGPGAAEKVIAAMGRAPNGR